MTEQVEPFINRALRDTPAEVPGWGQKALGALRGAWDSAAPGGSGDMAGDAVKGWKGTLPEPGPTVTSSPSGDALRATGPEPAPASFRSARVQPSAPAPGPAIGDTIAQAATDSGMKPLEAAAPEVRAAATPISQTVAQAGQETAALGQQPPLGAKNPAWGTGPSPEAQAWQARQAAGGGAGGVPPEVPPAAAGATPPPEGPGGLRGAAKKAGGYIDKGIKATADFIPGGKYVRAAVNQFPKLGAVAGGLSAYDAIDKASEGNTPEQVASKGEGGWRESPVRAGLAEFGDNMAFGKGRELGTALGAGAAGFVQGTGGLRGKAANAWDMAKQGWKDAGAAEDRVFGNGTAAKPSPASAAPSGDESGNVGKNGVGGGDPNATGGFKRTGDDVADYNNANAYLQLRGLDPNKLTAAPGHAGRGGSGDGDMSDALNGLRTGIGAQGPFGSMAALQIGGSMARMRSNAAGMQLRGAQIQATNNLAQQRMALEQYNKDRDVNNARYDVNTKQFDDEINRAATEMAGPQNTDVLGRADPTYDNKVKALASSLSNDIRYTLGDRKDGPKSFGQLSDGQKQQLFLLKKFKDKVTGARSGMTQSVRDYIGAKRFDSRNLDSYAPAGVEPTALPGGYLVRFKNGNTAQVNQIAGGGFNWTGPNEPVDADMTALIKQSINQR